MGRSGQAWSFVGGSEMGQLDKIANTWAMNIPVVEAPDLPKGAKEMARLKEDWDEISDSFGMVTVRVSVGKGEASKLALSDWIVKQARVPEVAIGEISMGDSESTVEVHVKKASYVIGVLKSRDFEGRSLEPVIVN